MCPFHANEVRDQTSDVWGSLNNGSRLVFLTSAVCWRTIEVPEIVFVAVLLPFQALVTFTPGAKISTMEP